MLIVKRSIQHMKNDVKTNPAPSVPFQPEAQELSANGTPSGIRLIPPQKDRDRKRKVFTIHETLLRRLAEHDPPLVTVEE